MSSVFPTHVGVNRFARFLLTRDRGLPHARGGEPERYIGKHLTAWSSPRTWG